MAAHKIINQLELIGPRSRLLARLRLFKKGSSLESHSLRLRICATDYQSIVVEPCHWNWLSRFPRRSLINIGQDLQLSTGMSSVGGHLKQL